MKTRKIKKIKTRKMKGGYIVYENGSWVVPQLKANGKPISPVVRAYSTAEASFFNALRVPRVNTKEWLKISTNANAYLSEIAPDILDHDIPEDVFFQGLQRMRTAYGYLEEAYRKRLENDINIQSMTPEDKLVFGITEEAEQSHSTRTKDIFTMLKEIKKKFMEPYNSKEKEILDKRQKTVKLAPKPPFSFSKILNGDSSSDSDTERDFDVRRAEVDERPKRQTRKSKHKPTEIDSVLKEFTSEVSESIAPIYTVSTFEYRDFIHPTSLCFSMNPSRMFVFSKNLMTLIIEDGTIVKHPIDNLDISFCDINDMYILLSGNALSAITVNGTEIQTHKTFDEPTTIDGVPKTYKGVSFLDKSGEIFFGVNAHLPQVETVVPNSTITRIALPPLNKPMGINYSPIFSIIAVAVSGNNTIVIVTPHKSGGTPSTKTIGNKQGFIDGREPRFNNPTNVLILPDGSIIVSDTGNHAIRRIYKQDKEWITETIAGNGSKGFLNGIGKEAAFNEPRGLSFFSPYLYVADKNNNSIRIIDLSSLFQ